MRHRLLRKKPWPGLLLSAFLLFSAPFLAVAAGPGGDAIVTYGDFEDLRRAHEMEMHREQLERAAGTREPPLPPWRAGFTTVAIDGAAGSGKTSTARALAEKLGFAFASTGEHYRLLTRLFLEKKIPPKEREAIGERLKELHPTTIFVDHGAHLSLDGRVLEEELRRPEINFAVSDYAAIPELREFLHRYQKELPRAARAAGFRGLVVEGRDTASAVFPDADLRVRLAVDGEERARRRAREGVRDDVAGRDRRDERQMRGAEGVWELECTDLSLEEVVELLCLRIAGVRR
jgi:cytidylate kinase